MTATTTVEKAEETLGKFRGDLAETGRNVFHAGLGAAAEAEEKSRSLFDGFVQRGRILQEERKKQYGEKIEVTRRRVRRVTEWARGTADQTLDRAGQMATETLQRFGVPTYEDIRILNLRVAELNEKVEALISK